MSDMKEEAKKVVETVTADIPANLGLNTSTGGPIAKLSGDDMNMPDVVKQAMGVVNELPGYVKDFYADNKSAVTVVGIVLGSIVGLKLTLAILSAINEIPLLAPTFEMVGIGYTAWFVYRYLLKASTRDELGSEFDTFKSGIFGKKG
jgi:CAAD domains of cyanobacterial aminoacyl-tRNA synthetase